MAVPGVGKYPQFFQGVQQPGAKRIQMNVTHQFSKMPIVRAQERLVSVLEQMAGALMFLIKIDSIARQNPLHECGQGGRRAPQQKVKVIWHQGESNHLDPGVRGQFGQAREKDPRVFAVGEDIPALYSASDHMVDQAGLIDPRSSWHCASLQYRQQDL